MSGNYSQNFIRDYNNGNYSRTSTTNTNTSSNSSYNRSHNKSRNSSNDNFNNNFNDNFNHDEDNTSRDDNDINPDLWYIPSQAIGISFLIRHCKDKLSQDIPYQTLTTTTNNNSAVNKQINFGLQIFNQARLDRYPYFLYTYDYDAKNNIGYAELLPWITDVNEVFEASPVLKVAIHLQVRQALKWLSNKGIYGVSGLKLLLVREDIVVNLPDMDLYSYGYIPMFTDFTNCTTSGNIVDELAKYPITMNNNSNIAQQLLVKEQVLSSRLLYPVSRNIAATNCSRFRYMIESYYQRLQIIYSYYVVNPNNFWTPVFVAIMKEYATMILAIGNHCFSNSQIYLDKITLLDKIELLSVAQVVSVEEMTNWQERLWMSTNIRLDKAPTIDNYIKGLRYYCYLRTCQSVFVRVRVPEFNFSVESKEREMFDTLREWQKYLLDTPSNLASYRALFVGDVEDPTLYNLAYDPLSLDVSNQPILKPVIPTYTNNAQLPIPTPLPLPLPVSLPTTSNIPNTNNTTVYPKKVKYRVDVNETYKS